MIFNTDGKGVGKGFTAKISYGIESLIFHRMIYIITSLFHLSNNHIFINALDNLCQNALDLDNGKLIIEDNLPTGTFCQWVISASDDNHYVNLEFEKLDVRTAES